MQDDLADLMADAEDISSIVGRSYCTPDTDDIDLDTEISMLGEWNFPEPTPTIIPQLETDTIPTYLTSMPSVEETLPSLPSSSKPIEDLVSKK